MHFIFQYIIGNIILNVPNAIPAVNNGNRRVVPDSLFEIESEKIHRIHTVFIQLLPGHAGITGPPIIGYAFPDLEMEMIRSAEIGSLEFVRIEKARQWCLFVHPITHIHLDLLNMGVNRV